MDSYDIFEWESSLKKQFGKIEELVLDMTLRNGFYLYYVSGKCALSHNMNQWGFIDDIYGCLAWYRVSPAVSQSISKEITAISRDPSGVAPLWINATRIWYFLMGMRNRNAHFEFLHYRIRVCGESSSIQI